MFINQSSCVVFNRIVIIYRLFPLFPLFRFIWTQFPPNVYVTLRRYRSLLWSHRTAVCHVSGALIVRALIVRTHCTAACLVALFASRWVTCQCHLFLANVVPSFKGRPNSCSRLRLDDLRNSCYKLRISTTNSICHFSSFSFSWPPMATSRRMSQAPAEYGLTHECPTSK